MALETDVILRTIYMCARSTKNHEQFVIQLKAIVGQTNVALVEENLKELEELVKAQAKDLGEQTQ